jgi:glycosyltransferase involved in cell wall biosynthesis
MAKAATRIWVSHPGQAIFLSALLARTGTATNAIAAFRLPGKTIEVPMGCSDRPPPLGLPNPYREQGIHSPVFLWGGGVWRWFDPETVLHAFSLLRSRSIPATLFFISGRNESTPDYNAPLDEVVSSASRRGLLDGQVVFNPRRVGPSELGPWLEHARAGIMGNMPTLESRMSWRTRYLDLLWAGKPLVVSGADPLAERMERRGAALISSSGDPVQLADAIQRLVQDDALTHSMSEASRAFGDAFSNKAILGQAMRSLEQTPGETTFPPGILEIGRYLLGI